MFLDEAEDADSAKAARPFGLRLPDAALIVVLVAPLLVFGILWAPVWNLAQQVGSSLLGGGGG